VSLDLRPADLDRVRELRHLVLRPHQPPGSLVYDRDDDPEALHLGAFDHGELVAIASVVPDAPPDEAADGAWRVRGMATVPAFRGRGIGGLLLERCVQHARDRGGSVVWCNGRVPAQAFYERHGFVAVRGPFDLPGIGPHVELRLALR
jgi:GNAT superfamily N-acetyltransferase